MKISTSSLILLLASSTMAVSASRTSIQAFTYPSMIRGGGRSVKEEDTLVEGVDGPIQDEPSMEEEPPRDDKPEEEASMEEESTMEESSEEEEEVRVEPPKARECETEAGSMEVTHECKAKTVDGAEGAETEIKDEIDFKVEASNKGICITVKYEQEIEEEATEIETETDAKFDVCFQSLIEYKKAEAGGATDEAYDWINDVTLQEIDLTEWADFSDVMTAADGISTFSAMSNDQLVTMSFTISPAGDGERLTANSMKADFRLVDFPWTEGEAGYVALLSEVESKLKVDTDYEEPDEAEEEPESVEEDPMDEDELKEETEMTEEELAEETEPSKKETDEGDTRALDSKPKKPKDIEVPFTSAVDTVGFSPIGKFTWAETAVVVPTTNDTDPVALGRSETTIQVIATSPPIDSERYLEYKTSQQVAFSFVGDAAQGSPDIFWDPEAGVDYDIAGESTSTSGVGPLVSSLGLVSGFISAVLILAY